MRLFHFYPCVYCVLMKVLTTQIQTNGGDRQPPVSMIVEARQIGISIRLVANVAIVASYKISDRRIEMNQKKNRFFFCEIFQLLWSVFACAWVCVVYYKFTLMIVFSFRFWEKWKYKYILSEALVCLSSW